MQRTFYFFLSLTAFLCAENSFAGELKVRCTEIPVGGALFLFSVEDTEFEVTLPTTSLVASGVLTSDPKGSFAEFTNNPHYKFSIPCDNLYQNGGFHCETHQDDNHIITFYTGRYNLKDIKLHIINLNPLAMKSYSCDASD